jgi:hypothetical protein
LKTVTASNRLTTIGCHAFRDCNNLEEITGLDGTITLCGCCFFNCYKLKSSSFSNTNILFYNADHGFIFAECDSLTTVPLSPNNTFIPLRAFQSSGIQTLNLPSSITSIGNLAFRDCTSLTTINLDNITTIGAECFTNCSNLQVNASTDLLSLTSLGSAAFAFSGISGELNCPNLTGELYTNAFRGCTELTKVTNLGSITKIGNSAFLGCSNLFEIHFPTTLTYVGEGWHPDIDRNKVFTITGLDNVTTHYHQNWRLWAYNIQNPVCNNTTDTESIISASNNLSSYTNSFFLPKMTKTRSG